MKRCSALLPLLLALSSCQQDGPVFEPRPQTPDEIARVSVTAVSAGAQHSCAIADRSLYCWGTSTNGALGLGAVTSSLTPALVEGQLRFATVATGSAHTCALADDYSVWCWGSNDAGQLGLGESPEVLPFVDRPNKVEGLPDQAVLLSTKYRHVCAVLRSGTLWCWGNNYEGQLGQGDAFTAESSGIRPSPAPRQVGTDSDWESVSTGDGHTCAMRSDGTLWCWGRNSNAQLSQNPSEPQIRGPRQVGQDTGFRSVDAALEHTCAIRSDDSLWCWGLNVGGALGFGPEASLTDPEIAPRRVGSRSDWQTVATRFLSTCGTSSLGALLCAGRDQEGQLGTSIPGDARGEVDGAELHLSHVLAEIEPVSAVSVGSFHTCAISTSSALFCAGENGSGQLGLGHTDRRSQFTRVEFRAP